MSRSQKRSIFIAKKVNSLSQANNDDVPEYCQVNKTENLFNNCEQKDNRLLNSIMTSGQNFSVLGDHETFYSQTIQKSGQLQRFFKKFQRTLYNKKVGHLQGSTGSKNSIEGLSENNTFVKNMMANVALTSKQKRFYKNQVARQTLNDKLLTHVSQLEKDINEPKKIDKDQENMSKVQKSFDKYKNYWQKYNIKDKNPKKAIIEDQEELKKCLGIERRNINSYDVEMSFKQGLREKEEKPQRQINRYHNLQFRPLTQIQSKWQLNNQMPDNLIDNKEAVYNYYLKEAQNQCVTEVNHKNKTFITEYARYLNETQQFRLSCEQVQNTNIGDLKKDFPNLSQNYCKKKYCQNHFVNEVDGSLINYHTQNQFDLCVNGQNQFKMEKEAILNASKKYDDKQLVQNVEKLEQMRETKENLEPEDLNQKKLRPVFYVRAKYSKC